MATSLERSNFNDVAEVAVALARSGIPKAVVDRYGSRLAAMMTRRHWIVHRADRNQAQGSGQFAAKSIFTNAPGEAEACVLAAPYPSRRVRIRTG